MSLSGLRWPECVHYGCSCIAFVADVNRPEPMTLEQAMALCTHQRFMVATKGRKSTWICQTCKVESDIPFAAVPDREGATEQLAALQRWKAEAMSVLDGWDRVHEALGSPGTLGQQKWQASYLRASSVVGLMRSLSINPTIPEGIRIMMKETLGD